MYHLKSNKFCMDQEALSDISISKPKAEKLLSPLASPEHKRKRFNNDPRSPRDKITNQLTESDIDSIADITNGNSGIVGLRDM